ISTTLDNRAKFLLCTPAPCSAVFPRVVARAARVVAAQTAAPELSATALATVCGSQTAIGTRTRTHQCAQQLSPLTSTTHSRPPGAEGPDVTAWWRPR